MADFKELTEMMKNLHSKFDATTQELRSVREELSALKGEKVEKTAAKPKEDKSFSGVYGSLLINEDGTGKTIKHVAELKDGDEDEWIGVWDVKNKVFALKDSDGTYETFGAFGSAHYKSLGERIKKTLTHDSNGGWDKVKVYDVNKKKFFTAASLLPQGEKPRSVSRSGSRSKKSPAASSGSLSIKKTSGRRVSIKLSPKVMDAANSAAIAAAVPAAAAAAVKAHAQEQKFFTLKDDDDKVVMVNNADDLENALGEMTMKEGNYFRKNKNDLFNAYCEYFKDNDNIALTLEELGKVFQQQIDN
jgi:hypothetical protein